MYLIFSCIFGYALGLLVQSTTELVPALACILTFHLVYQVGKDAGKK